MKKWAVWIEQINANLIRVEAATEAEARAKAKAEWQRIWVPEIVDIQEESDERILTEEK